MKYIKESFGYNATIHGMEHIIPLILELELLG
jgi:hypothetical protein